MIPASAKYIFNILLAIATTAYAQQQQQQQAQPANAAASGFSGFSSPGVNGFTPIRLIQPQTPEQQQAIQNLVQELQKTSPQLFSNIGQPGGQQQVALALPSVAPSTPAATPANSQPQQPVQGLQGPQTPQAPQAPAPAASPETFPATSSAPSGLATSTPPPMAVDQTESNSADVSTPFSLALNAMFQSDSSDGVDKASDDQSLPFGLRFDPSPTGLESASSGKSSIHSKHKDEHESSEHESDFEFFDDLSGLDSLAAVRAAMSLAAIGLSLLASVAFSL
ncbi:hypothetical protein BX070DRAFT_255126 [Coemansia spiralis]|nr:hypothetical protein BX070DRAFT_255126 [Coemansia spiralis]